MKTLVLSICLAMISVSAWAEGEDKPAENKVAVEYAADDRTAGQVHDQTRSQARSKAPQNSAYFEQPELLDDDEVLRNLRALLAEARPLES